MTVARRRILISQSCNVDTGSMFVCAYFTWHCFKLNNVQNIIQVGTGTW